MPVVPFAVMDCALASIAVGRSARNLRELRDGLLTAEPGCLYHHFWGRLLRPTFDHPDYVNDFGQWAASALGDRKLAERLAVLDPIDHPDMEGLRLALINVIEDALDESEHLAWAAPDQAFRFVRSQLVVFDTRRRLESVAEMASAMPRLSAGSVFFHLVDARRRTEDGTDDFRTWLARSFGHEHDALSEQIAGLDPYFGSLVETRARLAAIFAGFVAGGGTG